ncbi:MAG: two-component system, OmpR family, sensor histidine kinase SenX3 [Actinomycetota bacterium]|nr:two-component system, OmpR family, sensor histidine kinase SenX3 [Actinomycetota bacterium]
MIDATGDTPRVDPIDLAAVLALAVVVVVAARSQARLQRLTSTLRDSIGDLMRERDAAVTSLAGSQGQWDEVLAKTTEGVVILGHTSTPRYANHAARQLLGLGESGLPPRIPSEEITSLARQATSGEAPVDEIVALRTPERRIVRVHASPLVDGETLLTLQDVSEEVRVQTMRRQFVAHASHELKSPVASIHALGEAIAKASSDDPASVDRFAERLTEETSRLGRLVIDLLDLSRLEEPSVISNTTVDLSTVAAQEMDRAREGARSAGVDIGQAIEGEVLVSGDEQQVGLLIRNLLENAIRYSSPSGRVMVRVANDGEEAVLQVEDDGIGIPLRDQARVFERFYRVDEGRARSEGGTGLGLAIVKHIADLHGGSVELISELGEGSAFTVRLPGSGRERMQP